MRTMSKRHAIPALKTSKQVKVITEKMRPKRSPRMRDAHLYPPKTIAIHARAEGRRDKYSVTTPPLKIHEKTAISHAKKGGLKGMSEP